MKRPLRYIVIVILVICGILIAGTVLLHFLDLNPHRERIQNLASKMIGRQVQIKGHMDINLFPHPELILNNISLANAEWGTEPTMASVGHFDAAISFWSLFSNTIIIRRMRLNDVVILLEKNEQQVGNWVTGRSARSEGKEERIDLDPQADLHLPVIVDLAEFKNITVSVRGPDHTDQVYHLASLGLRPDRSGNLILKSNGKLLGHPMTLDGTIISQESVTALGDVKADFKASLMDAELTGQLATGRLATIADFQGTIRINVSDIQKPLKMLQIEAPFSGGLLADVTVNIDVPVYRATVKAEVEDITFTTDASYKDKKIELAATLSPLKRAGELFDLHGLGAEALNLEAAVAKSKTNGIKIHKFQADVGDNRLSAQGHINLNGEADLSLTLASPDLSTLLDTLPAMDIQAKASARYSAREFTVSHLVATSDKSDLKGDLTIRMGEKQNFAGALTSNRLDLRPFDQPTTTGSVEKKSESKSPYVFEDTPLPLALLQDVEADLKLSVNHFYYDTTELKNAVADAAVHSGHVNAKVKFDSANAGHAAARIDMETQGAEAIVDTLVSLSDYRMSFLATEGIRPEEVPPMTVSLALKTSGASPRQLASSANGKILFTQDAGKVSSDIITSVSSDIFDQLLHALNPFAKEEPFSNLDCSVVKVEISDGHAKFDTMMAQGEKILIVGAGDIDLKTEHLNIEFNTKPRSGIGVSADMFVTPFIKLKGTLANPAIGLNRKGTLLSGGAAVATGGLSLLLQGLFDRATASGDHCKETLERVGSHSRYDF